MALRGIRGAITIDSNDREEIISKTCRLLKTLVQENDLKVEDVASAIFSVTDDVNAEFPAVAARKLGWSYTPLLCTREIPVPGSLQSCIRILLHVNSDKDQAEMNHSYLGGAHSLRPDLDQDEC
jgi:chorismate mutase